MGLLSTLEGKHFPSEVKATEPEQKSQAVANKENIGLLQKTLKLSANQKQDSTNISQTLYNYNLLFCALFEKHENHFLITNSYNLDSKSIFSSWSTEDFWKGSVKQKNCWQYFYNDDNSLSQFYQFFSVELKDKIQSIAIFFTNEDNIIITGSEQKIEKLPYSFADELKNYFNAQNKDNNTFNAHNIQNPENFYTYKLKIDIEKIIDSTLSKNITDNSQTELFEKSICNELQNRIYAFFSYPNCCIKKSNTIINAVIYSKNEIKEELIQNHFIYSIKDFAEENSSLLIINFEGQAHTITEILEFLQAE
ncbi:MAG: hypothetical protein K6A43_06455 [Treponema sp.]|nr:hypothetical protein [Treponema sp.]